MTSLPIRAAAASLAAIAIAGCTTTGVGTGQSANGRLGATFTWTETGGTRGTMVAQLSNGQVFQGPFFQITSESVADYDPLVVKRLRRHRDRRRRARFDRQYGGSE